MITAFSWYLGIIIYAFLIIIMHFFSNNNWTSSFLSYYGYMGEIIEPHIILIENTLKCSTPIDKDITLHEHGMYTLDNIIDHVKECVYKRKKNAIIMFYSYEWVSNWIFEFPMIIKHPFVIMNTTTIQSFTPSKQWTNICS